MQQVKFLSQKLVAFEVIHELLGSQLELRLSVWVLGWGAKGARYRMAATTWLRLIATLVREAFKVDSLAEWLPLEIEEGLDGLDLDPPGSSLHRFSDEAWIVARADDVLEAVLDIGVIEWDFTYACLLL